MTPEEWRTSTDPAAMIHWLEQQGYEDALWEFTIGCCRRVWKDLPSDSFRQVVEHFEQIGTHDIDSVLSDAYRALEKLERRFSRSDDSIEQARLNQRIGFGRMVLAFENQEAAGAARSISSDLVEWADDTDTERQAQVELLRDLVADPSEPVGEEEAD